MGIDVIIVVAILILGFLLIAAEIFVIPGFGVAGVAGALVLIVGVVVAFINLGPAWGVGSLLIALAITAGGLWLFPRTRAGKRMVLSASQKGQTSADASSARYLGAEGTAVTPLRPSGTVAIGDEHIDVVTDGVYVEAGRRVAVVQIEGSRIVVEPIQAGKTTDE